MIVMENSLNQDVFFSIVVPTYNRGNLIVSTIQSILNQNFTNFELIIVDDGSTDNTGEVVAKFTDPRVKYFAKENKERGVARNFGVIQSVGKFVTFCDSDDLLYPDYLSNAYETISKNNFEISWMHLAYEILRDKKTSIKMSVNDKNFINLIAKGNPLSCMGVFVKRNILLENLFNEDRYLSGSEDWELWVRIASKYPIVIDKRVSAALIMHKGRSVFMNDELKLLLRKYLSIGYAFDEPSVQMKFGKYKSLMEAYFDSYISLHLMLSGKNTRAFNYLLKAVIENPRCVFERRFLAIFKHWFINILKISDEY